MILVPDKTNTVKRM